MKRRKAARPGMAGSSSAVKCFGVSGSAACIHCATSQVKARLRQRFLPPRKSQLEKGRKVNEFYGEVANLFANLLCRYHRFFNRRPVKMSWGGARKGAGRKPSADPTRKMSVAMRETELRLLKAAAGNAGKSFSRYVVDAALEKARASPAQAQSTLCPFS